MLLLTGALVAPYFVDWTNYKSDFENAAGKALGRPVQVKGSATAKLLPFPSVTFDDVVVGDDPVNPAMTIDRFSMDAELAPFLRGEVLVFDMRMERPRAFVRVDKDGVADWALRPQSPKGVESITLEKLSISNGAVEVEDERAGHLTVIDGISAVVSARSLAGPWRFDGELSLNGEPLALTGSTGKPDERGKLALRLGVSALNRGLFGDLTGYAELTDGSPVYKGDFLLRPALLTDRGGAALRNGDGVATEAPANGAAFSVKGKFVAVHDGVSLPDYRLETGPKDDPYFAEGSGTVSWGTAPRFDFTADGAQVRFDDAAPANKAAAGLAGRIAEIEAFLAKVPVPDMEGRIKVDLPAIVAGDTVIRDVAFLASPSKGGWDISTLSATLPGRTKLEASGRLGLGKKFGFTGKLLAASNQPSGLATWLAGAADEAVRKLPALGIDADVTLGRDSQTFDNLELQLGNTGLKGRIERRSDGAKPSISIALTGASLNAEDILPLTSAVVGPDNTRTFSGHDLDLTLKAGPVAAMGIEAQSVDVAVRIVDDRLDVDRLLVTAAAGASVSATAKLTGFPAKLNGTLDLSLLSADAAELVSVLAQKYPDNAVFTALADRAALSAGLLADTKVDAVLGFSGESPETRETSVSLSAASGGGVYSGTGVFKGDPLSVDALTGTVSMEGRHDDPLALMSLIGIPTLPVGAPAPVMLNLAAQGSLGAGFDLKATVKSDDIDGAVEGRFARGAQGIDGKGRVSMKSGDIEPFLMASGALLPGMGQGLAIDLSSDFTKSADTVSLATLKGRIADTGLEGNLGLDFSKSVTRADGALTLDQLEFGWLGETLFGAQSFTSADTGWPDTGFAARSMAGLEGSIDLRAPAADIGPLGSLRELRTILNFDAGALRLKSFAAILHDGALKGEAEARNTNGAGLISGNFTLTGARFDGLVPQEKVAGLSDITGSFSAGGKNARDLISSLSGTGSAKVRDLTITGINPLGFREIFAVAGQVDKPPEGANLKGLVKEKVQNGAIVISEADVTWTATNGVLRFSPVNSIMPEGSLEMSVTADLGARIAQARGQFSYSAGADAVAGAEPVVPISVSYRNGVYDVSYDAQPLGQYLAQRALEREQMRVEAMQEELLEGQRLRREARLYSYRAAERQRMARSQLIQEEEIRVRAAVKAWQRRLAEEKAAEEALRKAETEETKRREETAAGLAAKAALAVKPAPSLNVAPLDLQLQNDAAELPGLTELTPVPVQ